MDGGEIEVVLYDTVETITNTYIRKYDVITKEWVEVPVQTDDGSNENNESTGTNNNEDGNSNGGTTTTTIPNAPPTPNGGTKPTVSDRSSIKRIATATTIVNDGAGGGTSTSSTTDAPNTGESEGTSEGTSGETSGGTSEGTTTEETNETTLELRTTGENRDIEETTTTITKTNTITANITKANVWVIEHTAEYEKDKPEPEYPLGEEGSTVGPTNPETESYPPEEAGTWEVNIYETTIEKNEKDGWKLKSSTTKIEPDKFLGMWKNTFGIYIEGATFDPNGKLVTYSIPKQSNGKEESSEELAEGETETVKRDIKSSSPAEVLLSGKEMFLNVLEKRESTRETCTNNERTYKLLRGKN